MEKCNEIAIQDRRGQRGVHGHIYADDITAVRAHMVNN